LKRSWRFTDITLVPSRLFPKKMLQLNPIIHFYPVMYSIYATYSRQLLITLLLAITIPRAYSQIRFEKGYIIDQNGQRTECLIKNVDWKNNPDKIEYKVNPSEEATVATVNSIEEFQVYGYSKYIAEKVDIDRSSDNLDDLTSVRNPIWSNEKVFLKILVEGKGKLLKYEGGDFVRFFYSVAESPIQQLIHKEYFIDNKLFENNTYHQQLSNEVNCGGKVGSQIKLVKYNESSLIKYFQKYNECNGAKPEEEKKPVHVKRNVFNIKIAPGLSFSSLSAKELSTYETAFYKNSPGPRLGIESEFVFKFIKNKLSVLIEPTYQSIKGENSNGGSFKSNSISFPIGLRYYFFLKQDMKIFLNAHYVPPSIEMNSSLEIRNNEELKVDPMPTFAFGAGLELQRFSFETRYYFPHDIINVYDWTTYWSAKLKTISLIIGYKFLKVQK